MENNSIEAVHFRKINIYPETSELVEDQMQFLRKHNVFGRYDGIVTWTLTSNFDYCMKISSNRCAKTLSNTFEPKMSQRKNPMFITVCKSDAKVVFTHANLGAVSPKMWTRRYEFYVFYANASVQQLNEYYVLCIFRMLEDWKKVRSCARRQMISKRSCLLQLLRKRKDNSNWISCAVPIMASQIIFGNHSLWSRCQFTLR